MKILIIRSDPSYLGVSNATYNIQELGLARALTRRGHTCDILFWTDREEKTVEVSLDDGCAVRVFYRKGRHFLRNTVYTGCRELFSQYDILQSSEYNQMQSWLLAGKYPDKTVIYHGPYYCDFNKRYNLMCRVFDLFFTKRYIRRNTPFLVKSDLAREFLTGKGIEPANVTVAGVGIDLEALTCRQLPETEAIYQQMKADTSPLKLLYIGRFEPRRNIPFIIDVFKQVLEQNAQAKLYMIGSGNERYLQECFEYMQQCGVRDSVVWQKQMKQNQLPAIYENADFFLLPTRYEIFGMVLLEAMYFGTAVLTTRNGGASMLIHNEENGMVFDNCDAKVWAEWILSMSNKKEKLLEMQEQASATICGSFLWDSVCTAFEQVYKQLRKENIPADEV